jgi:hypothetical protein
MLVGALEAGAARTVVTAVGCRPLAGMPTADQVSYGRRRLL